MRAIFRVDASIEIGTGHVMRCLTLADRLREKDVQISFICRELTGNLSDYIESKGFIVHHLENRCFHAEGIELITEHAHWLTVHWKTEALEVEKKKKNENKIDWLIVDHYAIDKHWEQEIRPYVKNIMVIDDLADREHDCELLLDQNFYPDFGVRYDKFVPNGCLKLLGPQYTLLRSEFTNALTDLKHRDGTVKHILIYFGGIDITNETRKALEGICLLKRTDITVDVVVGSGNPHQEQIKSLCSVMTNVNFLCDVSNMAELMVKADLAIGAGGITTWERCYVGLPSITIVIAKNQKDVLEALHEAGAIWNLGYSDKVFSKDIARKINEVFANPVLVHEMSEKGRVLMKNRKKVEDYLM